jgi:hypothetical protein
MELSFGALARNRSFSKAMHRIRPRFDALLEAFGRTQLVNPIHQAILVGITDDKGPEFFEEVPNRDGYFQVLAGVDLPASDSILARQVFAILRRAAQTCPFSMPDQETIQSVFDMQESSLLVE